MFLPLAALTEPPLWLLLPFALILTAIAVFPFVNQHWWERNYHFVAVGLGSVTVLYYLFALGGAGRMLHVAHEYVSFLALIGSLFVVAGGIHLKVEGVATPSRNTAFLLGGAVLSNLIGTTGASMLLIRPWIRMNHGRVGAGHVVFFLLIVSNAGGCLTPIGDPPLFLGFLRGVPFWWVAQTCWSAWAIAVGALLVMFYFFDRRLWRPSENAFRLERIEGAHNVLFLALIVGAVFINQPVGIREALMLAAALGSWFTTRRAIHRANDFNFHPIKEVAWLFAGIFATMVPALDYLQTHAQQLGLDSEMKYYWLTGLPSAFLDNAPTYLTLLATAVGQNGGSIDQTADVAAFVHDHGRRLMAISLGAVFFGGLTYIGNGPNFMVKAIADHAGIRMPSFFGYLGKYALPILGPVLVLIALLFFSSWRVW